MTLKNDMLSGGIEDLEKEKGAEGPKKWRVVDRIFCASKGLAGRQASLPRSIEISSCLVVFVRVHVSRKSREKVDHLCGAHRGYFQSRLPLFFFLFSPS